MNYSKLIKTVSVCLVLSFFLTGCALVIQKGRRSDLDKIENLEQELSELQSAKYLLEGRLSQEIDDSQVKLEMQEKGLVITVLGEVLFDSGKAVLRKQSHSILNKVTDILKVELKEHQIGIEGHTDNDPIKHSAWKSNWNLSSNRALSVLRYFESKGVSSSRLSGLFYSQFKPVASNATRQGRQLNRRVEIVVLPRLVKELNTDQIPESEEVLK